MVSFRRLVTFGRYYANFRHNDHPDDHDEEFAFVDLAEDSPVFLPNVPGVPASELLRCWRSRLVSEQGEHDDDPLLTVTQELADLASRVGSVAISAGHKPGAPELVERGAASSFDHCRILGRDVFEFLGRSFQPIKGAGIHDRAHPTIMANEVHGLSVRPVNEPIELVACLCCANPHAAGVPQHLHSREIRRPRLREMAASSECDCAYPIQLGGAPVVSRSFSSWLGVRGASTRQSRRAAWRILDPGRDDGVLQ